MTGLAFLFLKPSGLKNKNYMDNTKQRLLKGINFFKTMVVLQEKYESDQVKKYFPRFLELVEQYIQESEELIIKDFKND